MLHPIILIAALIGGAAEPQPKFEQQILDSSISIGYGVALGDVDGDGKTDVLLADKKQIVWYRNGDWKKFVITEDLTEFDNVCVAARDMDGDGKVEVAVGAQWNPSQTSDSTKSGSVHFLIRPNDLTSKWKSVRLRHEPTVHRMRWMKTNGKNYLVVLPLHGRNNKGGEGQGVRVYAYELPADVNSEWKMKLLSDDMHMTHNMAITEENSKAVIYIAGKEGVRQVGAGKSLNKTNKLNGLTHGAGEIKLGSKLIATIEPMHGNKAVVYNTQRGNERTILDSSLHEGHALAVDDFLGTGDEQVIAGWRNPDKNNEVGIRMYSKTANGLWKQHWIDRNGMACEDLQAADLDGDGKIDIVASGRATKNIKIYWNKSK